MARAIRIVFNLAALVSALREEIGGPTAPDVELSATGATGIVATDDGVTALVLPFP